jgi:menaquinone-9 beta-reductase
MSGTRSCRCRSDPAHPVGPLSILVVSRGVGMTDVVVVGGGPAGAVAATLLARDGARVVLVERARFPRHKLCGDTLNPGALAILKRLRLSSVAETRGLRIDGMLVSGEGGVSVEGRYPGGLYGRSISRADFDASLVDQAVAAGVEVRQGVTARGALIEGGPQGATVVGVSTGSPGAQREIRAAVTIAADGRHSTIAFGLGLSRHPEQPRRWAIGAYLQDVRGMSALGEMHIRRGRYIGVAPLPGGLTNVCLVKPSSAADRALGRPGAFLRAELARDAALGDRFSGSRLVGGPHVLGPVAVDTITGTLVPDGLLLAGDACGFVDPMTGDGLRFAIRGGELAADAARRAIEHGWEGVHARLETDRQGEFAAKWRFNRALRTLVGSPLAVWAATRGARVAPSLVRALIVRASDCDLARTSLSGGIESIR